MSSNHQKKFISKKKGLKHIEGLLIFLGKIARDADGSPIFKKLERAINEAHKTLRKKYVENKREYQKSIEKKHSKLD